MFYDLNLQHQTTNQDSMRRSLDLLQHFGYHVVALNHTVTGKLSVNHVCTLSFPCHVSETEVVTTSFCRWDRLAPFKRLKVPGAYDNSRDSQLSPKTCPITTGW